MPSSLPSTGLLPQLTRAYDQAYEALAQGDVDRVQALVQRTGDLLAQLAGKSIAADQRAEAAAAHGRLQGAMQKVKDATLEELAQVRHGQKVLHGYTQVRASLGQRLESRG